MPVIPKSRYHSIHIVGSYIDDKVKAKEGFCLACGIEEVCCSDPCGINYFPNGFCKKHCPDKHSHIMSDYYRNKCLHSSTG